jgi:hypothetical protein
MRHEAPGRVLPEWRDASASFVVECGTGSHLRREGDWALADPPDVKECGGHRQIEQAVLAVGIQERFRIHGRF